MYRCMCRAKIKNLIVTETQLFYEGSITVDKSIIKKAGILPGEMVNVLNINNGARISTYVIDGEEGSGVVCLNGPAARYFQKGDEIIILGISYVSEEDIGDWKINIVDLKKGNTL